ncbi:MAG: GTPase HflX, partial [Selenomonadaceae bacterium]
MKVQGNTKNIKHYIIDQLETVYEMQVPIGQISTNEINEQIIAVTELLAREVAVYINRQGKVIQVAVGDTGTVDLPEIKERTSNLRLSGIRCIHTHPGSDTTLSAPDLSSLRRLRFDVMVALGKKGSDILASMAFFTGEYDDDIPQLQGIGPVEAGALHSINLTYLTTVVDKKLSRDTMILTEDDEERAILAGVELSRRSSSFSAEDSLEELAQLAQTAGAKVVGRV